MFDAHVPDAVQGPGAAGRRPTTTASQQWWYGDVQGRNLGLNAVAGKPPEMFNVDADAATTRCGPVATTSHERVRDMNAGGQLAGLNFPNFTGFSGQVLNQGPDRDVNLVMIKAYNDWHVDEWCGAYPDRFIPCGILPLFDVDEAAAEVRRLAAKGCHAVTFSREPRGARHAVDPLRALGSAVRGVLRRRARCCAATSGRRRSAHPIVAATPRAGVRMTPVVDDVDLHPRSTCCGRRSGTGSRTCGSR